MDVGQLCFRLILMTFFATGVFSLNIHIPHNRRDPGGKYTGFSLVLAAAAVITISILLLVHHWSKKAERRRRASL